MNRSVSVLYVVDMLKQLKPIVSRVDWVESTIGWADYFTKRVRNFDRASFYDAVGFGR